MGEAAAVSRPLYQLKAEFFKTLGHPARIRVLELLSEREHAVAELLPEVGIEAAHLSQQLAVLRRANLVISRKQGSTVYYRLISPRVVASAKIAVAPASMAPIDASTGRDGTTPRKLGLVAATPTRTAAKDVSRRISVAQ